MGAETSTKWPIKPQLSTNATPKFPIRDRDELRLVWTSTGMKFFQPAPYTWNRDEMLGAWFRDEMIWFFLKIYVWADRKAYRLEISGPGLRFAVICIRPVRTQAGARISRLGPAIDPKSDRSTFIVRPVSCKRIRRNVWRPTRTHAGSEFVPVSCQYPLRNLSPRYKWLKTGRT